MDLDPDALLGLGVDVWPGVVTFVTALPGDVELDGFGDVIACIREPEGMSLLVPLTSQRERDVRFRDCFRGRLLTLTAATPLDGVGLTAAVASRLAAAGVPCNMIAGHHHDHLVVPDDDLGRVLSVLIPHESR